MRGLVAVVLVSGAIAWAGPPKPPHGAQRVSISYSRAGLFQHDELHYVVEWKPGTGYVAGARAVDAARVAALYGALRDLHAIEAPERCTSHTDDFPELEIVVAGDEPMTLSSVSNCHEHLPWNIRRDGKLFAQYTTAEARAVDALLAAVDPEHWHGDDAEAPMVESPDERVEVSRYAAGAKPDNAAGACAHDLETSAPARRAFGAVRVTELALECDLAANDDCGTPIARARFDWDGVDANVELPCSAGAVTVTTEVAELHELIESKPVRALVRNSRRVQMRGAGTWVFESSEVDLPQLHYRGGSHVIEARSNGEHGPSGEPFWKELGLDPKKLTVPLGDTWSETRARLDFDGKLVKSK